MNTFVGRPLGAGRGGGLDAYYVAVVSESVADLDP